MARFPKTLRSTQKASTGAASGRLPQDPTAFDREVRRPVTFERLSPTTVARARSSPNPMGRRFTKFTTNYTGQVKIPHNLLSADRMSDSDRDSQGQRHIDVGQIPED